MSRKLDFEFYVGGLKTAILALLKNGNSTASPVQPPMTGVQKFAPYHGEFNGADLMSAMKGLAANLPAVLVAYGSGRDKQNAGVGNLDGEPIEFEHSCGLVVIVVCNNLRIGGAQRVTTADKMVGEARQLLGGVQFVKDSSEAGEPEHLELLNHTPLMFAGVETLLLLSDLTALAVSFTTSFKEWTPNRRVEISGTIDEILIGIDPRLDVDEEDEESDNPPAFNLPGVVNGE